ncbi:hypothetical protein VNO77_22844 [Canavalia gladiata]|uniref:Uncharacterized protein n=1 Tax=Canavalia gladiata TaxID=3824 RepID=A0AAN9QB59_CANGL
MWRSFARKDEISGNRIGAMNGLSLSHSLSRTAPQGFIPAHKNSTFILLLHRYAPGESRLHHPVHAARSAHCHSLFSSLSQVLVLFFLLGLHGLLITLETEEDAVTQVVHALRIPAKCDERGPPWKLTPCSLGGIKVSQNQTHDPSSNSI